MTGQAQNALYQRTNYNDAHKKGNEKYTKMHKRKLAYGALRKTHTRLNLKPLKS